MTEVTVSWYFISAAIGLIVAWSGFLVGVIKWLIGRMIGSLDKRLEDNNDECNQKWQQIDASLKQTDADLKSLMTQLPVEYQRREDSIREYTAINSKLDRMYELMLAEMQTRRKGNENA